MTDAFSQELDNLLVRRFPARELHDEEGQNLVYLRTELSPLASRTPGSNELGARLKRLERVVQASYDELHSAWGLMRSRRGPSSFLGEIQECARSVQANPGLLVDLANPFGEEPLLFARTVTYHATVVVPQARWNSRLHAQAARLTVAVKRKENGIQLTIGDDARGFAHSSCAREGHHGSDIMRERAKATAGRLQITSVS